MTTHSVKYEVIGRATVERRDDHFQHSLKLLYRGDGTPWRTCSAGLELVVPKNFPAKPGDFVTITVTCDG